MQLGMLSDGKLTNKSSAEGRNVVTGLLQSTFHRFAKGGIIVNNMNEPRQALTPLLALAPAQSAEPRQPNWAAE